MNNTEYLMRYEVIERKIRELDTAAYLLKKIRDDYMNSLGELSIHYAIGQHQGKMEPSQ